VILLDALYGEVDKFRAWMARKPDMFLVSVHTEFTASLNQTLQKQMRDDNLTYLNHLPRRIAPGTVSFVSVPLKFKPRKPEKEDEPLTEEEKEADKRDREKAANDLHKDFVTKSFTADTLRVILARVPRQTAARAPAPVTTAGVPAHDPNYVSKMPKPRPKPVLAAPKRSRSEAGPTPAATIIAPEPDAGPPPRLPTARQD
jgi:hypothetical protein